MRWTRIETIRVKNASRLYVAVVLRIVEQCTVGRACVAEDA